MQIKQPEPDVMIVDCGNASQIGGLVLGTVLLIGFLVLAVVLLVSWRTLAYPLGTVLMALALFGASIGAFVVAVRSYGQTWVLHRGKQQITLQRDSLLHSETHEIPWRRVDAKFQRHSRETATAVFYADGRYWTLAKGGSKGAVRRLKQKTEIIHDFLRQ